MKEPKRLLSHGATDFERQLLRAVVSERPSALLRSRMQRGLGLVGPLAWASNVKAILGTVTSRAAASVAAAGVVVAGSFAVVHSLPSSEANDAVAFAPVVEVLHETPRPEPIVTPPAPVVTSAPLPSAAEDDSQLREEIALLDTARSALQRGDREAARASLNTYRERFPAGILRREGNLLRGRAEAK